VNQEELLKRIAMLEAQVRYLFSLELARQYGASNTTGIREHFIQEMVGLGFSRDDVIVDYLLCPDDIKLD
jgi:hypothetical protein